MDRMLAELSTVEFERLIERTIDRRMEVWLTQLMDAFLESEDGDEVEIRPEFAAALHRSLSQAKANEGVSLAAFRTQLGS